MRPPPPEFRAWFPVIREFLRRLDMPATRRLTPTSWWRDVLQNDEVGGHPQSQHLYALAVDFVGSEDHLREAFLSTRVVGLIPVETGGFLNLGPLGEVPRGPPERRPGVHQFLKLHVQAYPAGLLASLGVPFPP